MDERRHTQGPGRSRKTSPRATADAPPVVLVHGILGQELLYWNFLRRRLESAGFRVREAKLPNLALGDMRASALAFRERLHELLDEGHDGVADGVADVVAHSAGGLVVRYYCKRLADPPRVRRLVTLGTPHQGTRVVGLLPEFGMLGQVRPGSEFLRELNAGDPTPPPTRYTAFWTPTDGVVVPAENARLEPAPNTENLRYPGITHWGYLFGPRMARVLAEELAAGFVGGEREMGRRPGVPART